jgi:endonuclease-3
MSTSNRAGLYKKTFRVLKKHYKPVIPVADRSLLEHLLYACCLENSQPETADEAYAKLQENYFDWNEIRVTSVSELSETLNSLTDPVETATRLKQVLQVVFETYYAFDLEHLKKQNLGKTVKELEKYQGTTEFSVDYITQNGLAGHSIATSRGTIQTLVVLGIVSEAEAKKRRLPGMERAIAKPKGVEFTSLLHQLGTDFDMTPFSSRVRAILLEIAADAKLRFPKRKTRKKAAEEVAQPAAPEKAATKKAATKKSTVKKQAKGKKTITKKASKPKAAKRKQAARKKTTKPAAKRPAKRKPR